MFAKPFLALISGGVLLNACASTDYGAREVGERPEDMATTEASLWYQMDEFENDLIVSGRLNTDPELNGFVSNVICNVAGEFCNDIRIYVVESPIFNASMAPNGMALVNTGLLLRAEDEDQLAFVLAHEFVHFEENHALERHGAARNANISAAIIGSALSIAIAGVPVAGQTGSSGFSQLGGALAYSHAFSFSREHEREADFKGLEYAASAQYNAGSSVEIWQNFLDELVISDNEVTVRRANSRGLFNSHPLMQERIDSLDAISADYILTSTDQRRYRATIRPYFKTWLDAQIVRRDYAATLHLIDRLLMQGEDWGVLHYAKARTLAMRNENDDREQALTEYQAAIEYEDAPVESYRGLGDLYRSTGDREAAIGAFRIYLELAPNARDSSFIEQLILNLEGTVQ